MNNKILSKAGQFTFSNTILAITTDESQPRTGGVRYIDEGIKSLSNSNNLIVKMWKKDFKWLIEPLRVISNLEVCMWVFKYKPRIIVLDSRMFTFMWLPTILCNWLKIFIVTSLQANHYLSADRKWNYFSLGIRMWMLKGVCRNTDLMIANSSLTKRLARDIYNVDDHRITVIHPGVDGIQAILSQDKNRRYRKPVKNLNILCVSRYVYGKGVDIFMNAIANINNLQYEAIIVGDIGTTREGKEYWSYLNSLIRNNNIKLKGRVDKDELESLYSWSDLVVVPSRYEAFGIVVLESLLREVPVLVSDALPPELIDISDSIYTFKSEDSDDLASCILSYYESNKSHKIIELDKKMWYWNRFQNDYADAISHQYTRFIKM